jgi:hypothetical protein
MKSNYTIYDHTKEIIKATVLKFLYFIQTKYQPEECFSHAKDTALSLHRFCPHYHTEIPIRLDSMKCLCCRVAVPEIAHPPGILEFE